MEIVEAPNCGVRKFAGESLTGGLAVSYFSFACKKISLPKIIWNYFYPTALLQMPDSLAAFQIFPNFLSVHAACIFQSFILNVLSLLLIASRKLLCDLCLMMR